MIRKFGLLNEYGQSYSLNDIRRGFLSGPSGLGYELGRSYELFGSEWVRGEEEISQTALTGTVVFGPGAPYLRAKEFTEYILSSKKLTLTYETDAGLFYKDVDLNKYQKTEIGKDKTLQCKVEMLPLTLWYKPDNLTLRLEADSGEGLRFPFSLPNRFMNFTNGRVSLTNDGHVPAPFKVTVNGPISNPAIVLLLEGAEAARMEAVTEIESGGSLEYSSKDGDIYLYKLSAAGERTDLGESLDISNSNFFKIPVGSAQLKVEADSSITRPVVFTVYKQYLAV